MTYQLIRHKRSGECYAAMHEDGDTATLRLCGPLHHSEVELDLANDYNYDELPSEDWNWDQWEVVRSA